MATARFVAFGLVVGLLAATTACGGGGGGGSGGGGNPATAGPYVTSASPDRVWAWMPTPLAIRGGGFGASGQIVKVFFHAETGRPFQGGALEVIETRGTVENDGTVTCTTIPAGVAVSTAARIEVVLEGEIRGVSENPVVQFHPAAELSPVGGHGEEAFGDAVAFDGTTLLVGSPSRGTAAGAAYVYRRAGSDWVQSDRLEADSAFAPPSFGSDVDVSGDLAVVGAPGENGQRGALYVFTRGDQGWVQTAYILRAPASPGDLLGQSVAVEGDTIVATADDDVHVYVRTAQGWERRHVLDGVHAAGRDAFSSVDISGDALACGAWSADERRGAVHVFHRAESGWTRAARLVPPTRQPDDGFGWDVCLAGDRLLIGAPGRLVNDGLYGRAHLYVRRGTAWTRVAYWVATHWLTGSVLGEAVAVSPAGVVVAAFHHTLREGAAFLFMPADASGTEVANLSPFGLPPQAGFGRSLAAWESTFVVGAWGRAGAGAVYVFELGGP